MIRNKKIAIIVAIIMLLTGILAGIYHFLFSGPGKEFRNGKVRCATRYRRYFQDSQEAIIHDLKEKGFIRNEWASNLILKKKDRIQSEACKNFQNLEYLVCGRNSC